MTPSTRWTLSLSLAVAAGAALAALAACGSDKKTPTQPQVRAECKVPTVTSFVDSAQGRVVIASFAYQPAEIHVRRGQSVRWVHCGPETDPHTVVANDQSFASPLIAKDSSYTMTFATAGRVPYFCTVHPEMQAAIVVEP